MKKKLKPEDLTPEFLKKTVGNKKISMYALAKKLGFLTKPRPEVENEFKRAVWHATAEGAIEFGDNWNIQKFGKKYKKKKSKNV